MDKQGVLLAKIEGFDRSRRGYVGSITRICNEIDKLILDNRNAAKVEILQSQLNCAWEHYSVCCNQYFDLLDVNCDKYHEVSSQYYNQRSRKQSYDENIRLFIQSLTSSHNSRVIEDTATSRSVFPAEFRGNESVELNMHSSEASGAQLTAAKEFAKVTFVPQEAQEWRWKAVQIEMKRMELEIRQKEIEIEIALLEAERSQIADEKDRVERSGVNEQFCVNASPMHDVFSREVPQTSQVLNIDQSPVFASVSGSPIAATYTSTCDNPPPLREVPPVLSVIDQPSAFRFSSAPGTYTTTTQAYVSTPLSSSTPRTTVLPSNKDDCASAQVKVSANSHACLSENELSCASTQAIIPVVASTATKCPEYASRFSRSSQYSHSPPRA